MLMVATKTTSSTCKKERQSKSKFYIKTNMYFDRTAAGGDSDGGCGDDGNRKPNNDNVTVTVFIRWPQPADRLKLDLPMFGPSSARKQCDEYFSVIAIIKTVYMNLWWSFSIHSPHRRRHRILAIWFRRHSVAIVALGGGIQKAYTRRL